MREIKFRAWHKKYKKMYRVQDLHMAHVMNGGIWATVDGRDPIEDKNIYIQIQPKDIEVMQYTGLKDKNGKDIYEGDIYLRWNNNHTGQIAQVVEWENPDIEGGYHGDIHGYVFSVPPHKLEVIGNIYENKELIK